MSEPTAPATATLDVLREFLGAQVARAAAGLTTRLRDLAGEIDQLVERDLPRVDAERTYSHLARKLYGLAAGVPVWGELDRLLDFAARADDARIRAAFEAKQTQTHVFELTRGAFGWLLYIDGDPQSDRHPNGWADRETAQQDAAAIIEATYGVSVAGWMPVGDDALCAALEREATS